MMTSSANNRGFSRMGVDPTISGLVDGTDFPHSALFHALNIATQGNYAIIEGNDFDITQSDSSGKTQFSVAAGRVVRNGALQAAVSTANFTQGTPAAFEEPTSGFAYYLLVVNSSNALELKNNGGTIITDIVPNPATTDIPIAVLRLGAGETTTQRHVQFLTTTKTANSFSIARDNSGVYTEMGTISCDANSIDITTTNSNANINLTPHGSGRVNILSTDKNDAELVISKDVGSSIGRTGISLISPNSTDDQTGRITLERTGSSAFIGMDIASDSRHGIRFLTGDGSETERMRIDDDGNIGIGTSSPTQMLHLSDADAGEPTILIENTGTSTTEPNLTFTRTGSHPSDPTVDIGRIAFQGDNDANEDILYGAITTDAHVATDSDERGRMRFHVMRAGAITEILRLGGFEAVVNEGASDVNFRVEGSSDANLLFADAGNDRVGFGTSSPKNKLQVSHTGADGNNGIMIVREDTSTSDTDLLGGIGFDSTDGNVPSSVLESSAYIAALAAEAHGTSDKGADLTFGTAAINENDDTVSTEHMRILSDGKVGIGTSAPEHFLHIDGANDNFPVRVQGNNGNVRINSFGQIQVQNDNSSPVDGATIDDPIWQIGQRDTGVFDISFGNISAMLVSATDKILEMKRSGNSATGAKQMGFFGTTAISQPAAPASVDSLSSTGNPANPEANADAINALITALTNLGLIG